MEREPASKSSSAAGWAAVIFTLPLLYVLSIGPVIFVVEKWHLKPAPTGMLAKVYAPLGWLAQKKPFDSPMRRYTRWWADMAHAP